MSLMSLGTSKNIKISDSKRRTSVNWKSFRIFMLRLWIYEKQFVQRIKNDENLARNKISIFMNIRFFVTLEV